VLIEPTVIERASTARRAATETTRKRPAGMRK
jgi:hypothetical protein